MELGGQVTAIAPHRMVYRFVLSPFLPAPEAACVARTVVKSIIQLSRSIRASSRSEAGGESTQRRMCPHHATGGTGHTPWTRGRNAREDRATWRPNTGSRNLAPNTGSRRCRSKLGGHRDGPPHRLRRRHDILDEGPAVVGDLVASCHTSPMLLSHKKN